MPSRLSASIDNRTKYDPRYPKYDMVQLSSVEYIVHVYRSCVFD